MRWCALLLLASCTGRPLDGPSASDLAAQVLIDLGTHDHGGNDLAHAPNDLGVPVDGSVAEPDLSLAVDLGGDLALDWQQVFVPNNEMISDISGWPDAVLVSTLTYDNSSSPVYLQGGIYSFDGSSWTTLLSTAVGMPWEGGFQSVYAVSSTEIYATIPYFTRTDGKSSIIGYDGVGWTERYSSTQDVFYRIKRLQNGDLAVSGSAKNQGGVVMIYSGGTWTRISTSLANDFDAVWGDSPTDLYAAGWPRTFLHWDGASWTDHSLGGPGRFFFAWGTADDDVYFGGPNVYRWNGAQVASVITGPDYFYDVWQAASDRAYLVGCVGPASCSAGVVYSFDGASWTQRNAPPGLGTMRIWGRSDDDLWVSSWGALYHHGP